MFQFSKNSFLDQQSNRYIVLVVGWKVCWSQGHIITGGEKETKFSVRSKMKGTSTLFQSVASFVIVYCFLTLDTRTVLSPFVNNPFAQINEFLQHILQPRLERSVIQEPESFMSTVTIHDLPKRIL